MDRRLTAQIIGTVACVLFAISIFLPILQSVGGWSSGLIFYHGPNPYWSVKTTTYSAERLGYPSVSEAWFLDYWTSFQHIWTAYLQRNPQDTALDLGTRTTAILIITFISQILTLLSATVATVKSKPRLFLLAAGLSILTTVCMLLFNQALNILNFEPTLDAGFYLTIPTAALFISAYLIGRTTPDATEAKTPQTQLKYSEEAT